MEPATPSVPGPARPARREAVGDLLRAALVVLLAFFLASFPARNSDAWRHLATGRALVEGTYPLGTDPLAYTTEGRSWANPAWLTDLLAYGLYQLLGGTGLVVLKAGLVALLAVLLLGSCWARPDRWLAALAVALALVAMGPYLALRPTCLSYLFLGFTFWWLRQAPRRPRRGGDSPDSSAARTLADHAPLLVAFVLWANLDEWFLLGPLTVALYGLGAWIEARAHPPAAQAGPGRLGGLGLVALAGLAVCLLTPNHVRAFTVPAALGLSAAPELLREALGPAAMLSPFQPGFWTAGPSAAAVAYGVLVLLGLVSFAIHFGRWRWARALVWLVLFLLSAYRGAAIPFFAVVAGPIMALNLQDYLARRRTVGPAPAAGRRRYARWGQAAIVLVLVGAAVAAWPGWLEGTAPGPRRWALEMDPSLKLLAAQLARWRADGRLPADARGLSLSPATADCLAWLCPEDKDFLDSRPRAFAPEVVADYLALRRALLPAPTAAGGPDWKTWREILGRRKVTHLILADANDRRLVAALRATIGSPDNWRLVYLVGRATVFVWRDPAGKTPVPAVPELDLERRAFRPPAGQKAPRQGPEQDPQPRKWEEAFWQAPPARTANRDEALVYLAHFEARRPATLRASQALLENGLAAGLVGLAVPGPSPAALAPGLFLSPALLNFSQTARPARPTDLDVLALQFWARYAAHRDDGPPGSLLLAIRAARRAIREQPDDPAAYLLLGRAYVRLMRQTRERTAAPRGSALDKVRKVQAITALSTALRLRPGLAEAHADLAALYEAMGYLDLALDHVRELVKQARAAGPRDERLRRLEEKERDLDGRVHDLLHRVETESYNREAVGRARLAEARGLAAHALKILVGADSPTLGHDGALLEVQLLLFAGRAPEVRDWLGPRQESMLGREAFHWLRAELAAARGDYALADQDLEGLPSRTVAMPGMGLKDLPCRQAVALSLGKVVLDQAAPAALLVQVDPATLLGSVADLDQTLRAQVDLLILRGLLALEAGETGQAAAVLREGLALWRSDPGGAGGLARHYLEILDRVARP